MPVAFFELQHTENSWNHYAEPSSTGSLGTKNGNYWPHGRVIGGSSSINGLAYVRGNRRDFDTWAELGNPTWDWDSVLEYFKKSEDNRTPIIASDTKHHSTRGPLKVESLKCDAPAAKVIGKGLNELGIKSVENINADNYLGLVTAQRTIENGKRCSAAKAFLLPAKDRPNLHIIKHAHVTTLDFNDDKSVSRVNFVVGEERIQMSAKATKEFILSAGALHTPQILMNSGIGPREQLEKFDIKSIFNLPVGENLQDHIMVPFFMTIDKPLAVPLSFKTIFTEYYNYLTNSEGMFANLMGGLGMIGYANTLNDSPYPDVQMYMLHFQINDPNIGLMFSNFGYRDEIVESLQKINQHHEIGGILVALLNPKSVGRVELKNTDPFDAPKYISNYLDDGADVETLLRGFKMLKKLPATDALRANGFKVFQPNVIGCAGDKFDTDDYWRCYIRHLCTTVYHPTGTTKMGPDSDETAVVDSRLRVRGVKGLRVIDAGIMPNIVSANTNAAVIMIGEKGADFIKEDWAWPNSKDEL